MAYEGERMFACPAGAFDFRNTWIIVVSGSALNPAGHMLLNTGGRGGRYFQVAGVHTEPLLLNNEASYQRYLKESRKTEIRRFRVNVPNPDEAQRKLDELLSQPWAWKVVVHNCEGLVEDIVVAGGGPRLHPQGDWLLPVLAYPQ